MITEQKLIEATIGALFNDSKNDRFRMVKAFSKRIIRPIGPADFKDVYLSISAQQGEDLKKLIWKRNIKNIVEFGTSFGISTLFLAQGVIETKGHIITTELVESKAFKAVENFKKAGVGHFIEVRIGDAMETLKNHVQPIDLLVLDGWKDLYLQLFQMLEPSFHLGTIVYVDNADMSGTRAFLKVVSQNPKYHFQSQHGGKVVLISVR